MANSAAALPVPGRATAGLRGKRPEPGAWGGWRRQATADL